MCWRLFWRSQILISSRSERFEESVTSQVVTVQLLLAPKYWLSCCGLVEESRRKKPAPEWCREVSSCAILELYLWKVSGNRCRKAAKGLLVAERGNCCSVWSAFLSLLVCFSNGEVKTSHMRKMDQFRYPGSRINMKFDEFDEKFLDEGTM